MLRLPALDTDGYQFLDGEERSKVDPDTFVVPPLEERTNLKLGDTVKLLFNFIPKEREGDELKTERMWVHITKIVDDFYVGYLDNQPYSDSDYVSHGIEVTFKAEHIIDIYDKSKEPEDRRKIIELLKEGLEKGELFKDITDDTTLLKMYLTMSNIFNACPRCNKPGFFQNGGCDC